MSQYKILVVEDDPEIADSLADMLEILNHEVAGKAESFDQAMEIIREGEADLALVDIQLKGQKTGIDLAEQINNNYNLPKWSSDKSLVILSSYSGDTEETISCYKESLEKNINPIILTSGGYLLKEAIENNLMHFVIPQGILPRAAFGYMSSILLLVFQKFNLIKNLYNVEFSN